MLRIVTSPHSDTVLSRSFRIGRADFAEPVFENLRYIRFVAVGSVPLGVGHGKF